MAEEASAIDDTAIGTRVRGYLRMMNICREEKTLPGSRVCPDNEYVTNDTDSQVYPKQHSHIAASVGTNPMVAVENALTVPVCTNTVASSLRFLCSFLPKTDS